MPLLADYAITPDVLDIASYTSEEVCGLHLREISQVMRDEGLVRDLHAGEWRRSFARGERSWHRWGAEMVRKLAAQGRLVRYEPELPGIPSDDREWCEEALRTSRRQAYTGGIIVTEPIKTAFPDETRVERVDRLNKAAWWTGRSPSVRLSRTLVAYTENLRPILRCANSLQFIDPHLDPTKLRYRPFVDLLSVAGRRDPAPVVEIHRCGYSGSGPSRETLDVSALQRDFRGALADRLRTVGLQVEVFVWDEFHDRYLISNLIGILMPNGFDTKTNNMTTWSRMGRKERDDVQREFDPASRRHVLLDHFCLP